MSIVRKIERDGLAVLPGLFPLPLLRRLRAEVLRRHESGELRERGLVRDIAGRYTSILPFEGPFLDARLYANPALAKVLPSLLGPDYRLSSLEAVIAESGAAAQYQHIDGPLRWGAGLSGLPPYALALATPLCDVDEENGPTALWPGSHRAAGPRLPSERAITRRYPQRRMTGRFGFSYLYDYRTFHRGTPNNSGEARPLLMLVFARSWYRDPNLQDVSAGVAIRERDLKKIPKRHRDLFLLAPAARRPLWGAKK
ncbi:MAG: phytanoyl-CoA dioxygenase family protein [Elusimicrobia bacterium]|nr:phytanoyl-CoA dioxygenase family protein [Elusimicrobiota bacterium]